MRCACGLPCRLTGPQAVAERRHAQQQLLRAGQGVVEVLEAYASLCGVDRFVLNNRGNAYAMRYARLAYDPKVLHFLLESPGPAGTGAGVAAVAGQGQGLVGRLEGLRKEQQQGQQQAAEARQQQQHQQEQEGAGQVLPGAAAAARGQGKKQPGQGADAPSRRQQGRNEDGAGPGQPPPTQQQQHEQQHGPASLPAAPSLAAAEGGTLASHAPAPLELLGRLACAYCQFLATAHTSGNMQHMQKVPELLRVAESCLAALVAKPATRGASDLPAAVLARLTAAAAIAAVYSRELEPAVQR